MESKFGGDISGLFMKERYHLSLEVLEQSHGFANLQEIKLPVCWLATRTARIEGRQMELRTVLYALHHYALRAKYHWWIFILTVSTLQ